MSMRLRTKVSCTVIAALGVSSLTAFASGCIGDDNAAPADSGVDATANEPDTSVTPDAFVPDTGLQEVDAGQDASDSAVADTGVDAGCAPALPVGWTPPAYVPTTGEQIDGCQASNGSAEIDSYWVACLGDASTPATCAAYPDAATANAHCATCLLTPEDASAYGPEVVRVVPQLNLAGCIQMADPSDGGLACATAIQAVQACAEAACRPSCAVTSDPASVAAYVACAKAAAASTACSPWTTPAAACLSAESDAGYPVTNCFAVTDEATFDSVGFFFCGS